MGLIKKIRGFHIWRPDTDAARREATRLKQEGDHASAAVILEQAIHFDEENPRITGSNLTEQYPELSDYLRLAMYLQAAARADEGWQLLNRLLLGQYPERQRHVARYEQFLKDPRERTWARAWMEATFFQDQARVYDKMRIFLHREGRLLHSFRAALMSYAADMKSLAVQATVEHDRSVRTTLREVTSEQAITEHVHKSAKRARLPELADDAIRALSGWAKELPDAHVDQFSETLQTIVGRHDRAE